MQKNVAAVASRVNIGNTGFDLKQSSIEPPTTRFISKHVAFRSSVLLPLAIPLQIFLTELSIVIFRYVLSSQTELNEILA